ncbi:hypothetical protein Bca52824_018878 [Brassica carinata]|uniref:Uncharacterized protein n=1 Tax=Brassica carinata TaxID=52824 RepID=A0A8X7VQR9_BRACI|nr:hypothetical protein Bca52824_018878 [Brassica carinata]
MPKRGEEIRDSSISSGRPTLALNPTGSVARVRCFDLGVDAEETLWKDRDMRHLVVDEGVFRMSDDEDGGSIDRLARGTRPIGSGSGKRRSIGLEVLGKSSRRPTSVIERLTPFRCRRDGTIEELPDLVPGLARSCALCEQDWVGHPNTFGPWDDFRRNLPKLVVLRPREWRDFDRKRIRRQRRRIAKVDWASNILCEEPKGKKIEIADHGDVFKGVSELQRNPGRSTGGCKLRPYRNADGMMDQIHGISDVSIDQASMPASVSIDLGVEESAVVRPPKKKRRRTNYSKEARADPPLDGDEWEVARIPLGPRDDEEMEGDHEDTHMENSTGLPGEGSSGEELRESSEATRLLESGTLMMLSISELAFPDKFTESTCADAEAVARKNALVMEYETALPKALLDLKKAEETIRVKEAELETVKKEKLDKAKELEELETALRKISHLEAEKVEELEKTKRAKDRMRQSRNREPFSERSCVAAAATRRFEKFRKYMARDKKEEKCLLHGTAFGTLDALRFSRKGTACPASAEGSPNR